VIAKLQAVGRAAFGTPARAAATLALYLAAHAAVRLVLWPDALGYDDAEQVLSAQSWAWSYRYTQPPLVTWLLLALRDVAGLAPGLVAITVLRTAMLAALHVFTYLAARRVVDGPLPAALASASLAGTYTLGYLAHGDLPHSTLLAVAVAASLWLWLRLIEAPTPARTLAFGVVCGLGLLAKWNFVVLALGYLGVGLAAPATRRLVLSWRTPVVVALAGAIAAPSAWWVATHHPSLAALGEGVLVAPADAAAPGPLAGLGALATSALAFPQPWLVLALLVLWPARRRLSPAGGRLAALIVGVLALHALLVPVAGAVNFPERWMIVPLLPLPLLGLAAVDPGHRAVPALGGVLVALAVAVVLVRATIGLTDAAYCGTCRTRLPAAAFAEAIRDAGFVAGTVVAPDMHLAGNLKRWLPRARVVVPRLPAGAWPAPADGQCVVVWRGAGDGEGERAAARRAFGAALADAPTRRVTAPLLGARERRATMSFRLGAGEGSCR
jgi:4-amino-4-deoxy-L-arabinose transferase-like glycosyltransferase